LLCLSGDHSPASRQSLRETSDAYLLRPYLPGELLAQVRGLLRVRLAHKTGEAQALNQQLSQALQQHRHTTELARRVQDSLRPRSFPASSRLRFAIDHRPSARAGGDCFDVIRLDEVHVGFFMADVMGHGPEAGLLALFLHQQLSLPRLADPSHLSPERVLSRLNRALLDLALPDPPFITLLYGVCDERDGTLRFARAGHPPPLYLPHLGEPEFCHLPGSLLGMFDTEFTAQARVLRSGDRLLLYTDGLDPAGLEVQPTGSSRLRESAARGRSLPLAELIERVAGELRPSSSPQDDCTLLGLEMSPSTMADSRPLPE